MKRKQALTVINKRDEKEQVIQKIEKAKNELIADYRKNLKSYLEQGLFDLMYKLKHKDGTLSTIEINSYLRNKNAIGTPMKYSVEELGLLYKYYAEFIEQINKHQLYPPTQKNFCSFAGIGSSTYDAYKTSDDPERREIMNMIDDYITDIQLSLAQERKIDNVTTIYRTKSENKMIEAQAPIVYEVKRTLDLDEIMKNVNSLKSGKPIIEIEKEN